MAVRMRSPWLRRDGNGGTRALHAPSVRVVAAVTTTAAIPVTSAVRTLPVIRKIPLARSRFLSRTERVRRPPLRRAHPLQTTLHATTTATATTASTVSRPPRRRHHQHTHTYAARIDPCTRAFTSASGDHGRSVSLYLNRSGRQRSREEFVKISHPHAGAPSSQV
jgi:hypothetical protein|uniref:Uncharacterized protein n=1 Tax=Sipha flava TaxID=143950 RepID=A0A2S2R4T2_9HEMI